MNLTVLHNINKGKINHLLIILISTLLVTFQLYTAVFGVLDALLQRSIHLLLGLTLIYLIHPFKISRFKWLDYCLMLFSEAPIIYIFCRYEWVTIERFGLITPLSNLEIIFGLLLLVAIIEAVHRVIGFNLTIVTFIFLVYPLVSYLLPGVLCSHPVSLMKLTDFLFLSTSGIFGIPLGVSASEIGLFIIFASLMIKCGASNLLNQIAFFLTKNSKGGPAKVAVVGSSLMGTIAGSGTANVVATGSITIPLMKKVGFPPHYAAGIEAVASTGSQMMPPVMGATAFVIAAFSGIPYQKLMLFSLLPSVLFYFGLYVTIHFASLRFDIPLMKNELNIKQVFYDYGHLLIAFMVLFVLLFKGFSPRLAASAGIISAFLLSLLRSTTRLSMKDLVEVIEDATRAMLIVIAATAAAGIIVGSIDLTGFGHRIGHGLLTLSGGNIVVALMFTSLFCIILGMGMPTTPAYVIQAATVIPALIFLGVEQQIAHLFVFYFCCLSLITPPVAVTSYVAASVGKADVNKTGWAALRLGIAGYIIPFVFYLRPQIMLLGSAASIVFSFVITAVAIFSLALACEGFWYQKISILERFILLICTFLLLIPTWNCLIFGFVMLTVILGKHVYINAKKLKIKGI